MARIRCQLRRHYQFKAGDMFGFDKACSRPDVPTQSLAPLYSFIPRPET